jgi:hypothetical protein
VTFPIEPVGFFVKDSVTQAGIAEIERPREKEAA